MAGPTRRDFLKLGSMLSGALAASPLRLQEASQPADAGDAPPNIIIFVFDAMSAKNLSLYGYPRKTTPNFERFAQHATVYHQHYAPANFTSPGTASLLTGLYPWTHRAINFSGLIAPRYAANNFFRALGPQYHRLAFSQNSWPNYFFGQFEGDLEKVLSPGSFSILDQFISAGFSGDLTNSHRAFDDFMFHDKSAPPSLVLGLAQNVALYEAVVQAARRGDSKDIARVGNYNPIFFRLEDVFNGMLATLAGLKRPFLTYLHIWSPHSPYEPAHQFAGLFNDDWHPLQKPRHILGSDMQQSALDLRRRAYDRYIANVDFEFGRLLDALQANGLLDTSYVIIASDHGEMLERGVQRHITPLLYEPVVRVPLIISSPGQTVRRDVHVPTSNVDLLPTLVHLAGNEPPSWAEGQILPGLGGAEQTGRSIFISESKENRPFAVWSRATFALRKDRYKLIYYMGYEQYGKEDTFELYDIEDDPEELKDLYSPSLSTAQDLRRELLERVQAENVSYPGPG